MATLGKKICMTTAEAATYLGVSESWLRQRRMTGTLDKQQGAPPFVRLGRSVRYRALDLDTWLAAGLQSGVGHGE